MRAFTVSSAAIANCPTRNLSPQHWREDGTCLHQQTLDSAKLPTGPRVDLRVTGGGSLFELWSVSDEGAAWIKEHVSGDGYNPGYPKRVIVEHRYIRDIVNGAVEDGLVVK